MNSMLANLDSAAAWVGCTLAVMAFCSALRLDKQVTSLRKDIEQLKGQSGQKK